MRRAEWTTAAAMVGLGAIVLAYALFSQEPAPTRTEIAAWPDHAVRRADDEADAPGPLPDPIRHEDPADLLADLVLWDSAPSTLRRRAAEEVVRRIHGFRFASLARFASGGVFREVALYVHERTGMEFSLVPPVTFTMGSPEDEEGRYEGDRYPDHETRHRVTLTSPYLIARTTVTQQVWTRVMGSNPSLHRGADLPVENVTLEDARRFSKAVGLSLPTEAEWAHACRAGTTAVFSFGSDAGLLEEHGWFDANSGGVTRAVASKRPNAFGLYDMHGNVWEWCLDRLGPFDEQPATDPRGPAEGDLRVLRGGCFSFAAHRSRSAARGWAGPDTSYDRVGFRPVRPVTLE
ncbi:MAG: formylglycine-generating enzyme family protein [Planctomycetota bacterium]|jgi:formylglycine-generating enzyme required for sulfatase activity